MADNLPDPHHFKQVWLLLLSKLDSPSVPALNVGPFLNVCFLVSSIILFFSSSCLGKSVSRFEKEGKEGKENYKADRNKAACMKEKGGGSVCSKEQRIKSSKCKAMIENSREGETQITIQKDEAKKQ
eukprot:656086-Pelagomonas_calceolata.AAC.10